VQLSQARWGENTRGDQQGQPVFFVFGFEKNERANISGEETRFPTT
jgi:hypothetical protein